MNKSSPTGRWNLVDFLKVNLFLHRSVHRDRWIGGGRKDRSGWHPSLEESNYCDVSIVTSNNNSYQQCINCTRGSWNTWPSWVLLLSTYLTRLEPVFTPSFEFLKSVFRVNLDLSLSPLFCFDSKIYHLRHNLFHFSCFVFFRYSGYEGSTWQHSYSLSSKSISLCRERRRRIKFGVKLYLETSWTRTDV